ncbi:MAG: polysaccharide deacetylase family protein [candidate division KSB1 bacterium]|nr:polysaccharide deacetylase family protein [candidate division KSB1 bacterium]MDZ7302557.1 polysaccharide deacetylase family protein [candidate division KSB1 bacterium]MDZ7310677.1 polysaccharide deacetylase family protein [candidate division KSB1 bacterium]
MEFRTTILAQNLFSITTRAALFLFWASLSICVYAQDNVAWQGKKCAVCLTYDDALNVHLDNVVPILDSLGLKGTFYLSGYFPSFRERMTEWKAVAAKGHELGNHTLFHPCTGKLPGREWVKPDYDLGNYTMQRLLDEITMANTLLEALDGKTKRSFAYPCGDMKIGDSSYVDKIRGDFVAARGVKGEMPRINEIDLYNIGAYLVSGQSGEELIDLVKQAMQRNALIVFLFHGVGGEHSLDISLRDHSRLLHFLKQNEKNIWIAPFVDIAEHVKEVLGYSND